MIRCPRSLHHLGVPWRHHSGVTSARAAIPGEGEGQAPRHALALTCASDVTGGVIDEEKSAVERQIPGRSHLPSQPSGRGGVAGIMVLGKTQHPQNKHKSTLTLNWVAVCFCVPGHGYSLWFDSCSATTSSDAAPLHPHQRVSGQTASVFHSLPLATNWKAPVSGIESKEPAVLSYINVDYAPGSDRPPCICFKRNQRVSTRIYVRIN